MKINIICVEIETMGNLGAIARLCANFQVDKLIVVRPQCRLFDKVVYQRATDGKIYIDNIIKINNFDEIRQYSDYLIALTGVSAKSSLIRNPISIFDLSEKLKMFNQGSIGLVLGPEGAGLSNKHLKMCDISATIPLISKEKSMRILNISHAASIALYELNRFKLMNKDILTKNEIMNDIDRTNIMKYYDEIIEYSLLKGTKKENARIVFNSIFNRSFLNKKEVHIFMSILRSILMGFSKNKTSSIN